MIIISPIPPSVNQYIGKSIIFRGGRPTIHEYKTERALQYERQMDYLLEEFKVATNWETVSKDSFLEVKLRFYMDKKRRDPDNCLKMINDSFTRNGIIHDDYAVLVNMEDIVIDKKYPRIIIELNIKDKVGIFGSNTSYTEFLLKNCHKCRKFHYKKPCGILKEAKANYIIDDIDLDNMKCKSIYILGGNKNGK